MDYPLKVGFARVDITPKESVPLGGYGNTSNRMSRAVRDNLYASCYAITDETDNTVLFINMDVIHIFKDVADKARENINARFGIPKEHIMISATHTHAGPEPRNTDEPSIVRYNKFIDDVLPSCAGLALANRTPSKLYMGDIEATGLNFVKHYKASPPDREPFYFGDNFNDHLLTPEIVQKYSTHATDADPTVHILKFVRKNAKDLIITNWRAHPLFCSGIGKYDLSAEYPGDTRNIIESETDCFFTYFQGACGNINARTRINSERITTDCLAFSKIFSKYILKGLDNLKPVEVAPLKFKQTFLELPVDHSQDEHAQKGLEIWQYFIKTGDRTAANNMGIPFGFRSCYGAIDAWRKAHEPESFTLELDAISLGNLAIVTAPNELFDTVSVYTEENAPFDKVLTFGYSNDNLSYVPSSAAYDYGCYEADHTSLAKGCGEKIAETFVSMLNSLK